MIDALLYSFGIIVNGHLFIYNLSYKNRGRRLLKKQWRVMAAIFTYTYYINKYFMCYDF